MTQNLDWNSLMLQINYPKFGGGGRMADGEGLNAARLKQMPRRRPGEVILKELEEEQRRKREAMPPRPAGTAAWMTGCAEEYGMSCNIAPTHEMENLLPTLLTSYSMYTLLAGPLLDEVEKARLADMMRFRGKVPEATAEEREEAARHRGARKNAPRNKREELQALFKAVMQEVEERRAFLAEMQAEGALKRDHVHLVQAEIKTRVEDMNRIDRMLRDMDG